MSTYGSELFFGFKIDTYELEKVVSISDLHQWYCLLGQSDYYGRVSDVEYPDEKEEYINIKFNKLITNRCELESLYCNSGCEILELGHEGDYTYYLVVVESRISTYCNETKKILVQSDTVIVEEWKVLLEEYCKVFELKSLIPEYLLTGVNYG